MEDLLSRAPGEEIAVELVISGGLWNPAVVLAQVENAVLNLAVEARDPMPVRASADGRQPVSSRCPTKELLMSTV